MITVLSSTPGSNQNQINRSWSCRGVLSCQLISASGSTSPAHTVISSGSPARPLVLVVHAMLLHRPPRRCIALACSTFPSTLSQGQATTTQGEQASNRT